MRDSGRIIRIGDVAVGQGCPVFIIAEAGVNHNGDLDAARALIREAKAAGADAVKFQTFRADGLVTAAGPKAPYQIAQTGSGRQLDMLRQLELDEAAHRTLKASAERDGIVFFSTPYGIAEADFLHALGVPAFKLASAQLVEDEFVAHVAAKGVPVLLSTGMANLGEVRHAVDVARRHGLDDVIVLQCTTNYPTDVSEANVRAMNTMGAACDVIVGYSDHTETPFASIAAVALAAAVIEKHLTLDRSLPGPDHASSFDPPQFRAFVDAIRQTERALGSGVKEPALSERQNVTAMRRSVVALRPIVKGTVLTREMVGLKRPATGLAPSRLPDCLGRRAACHLAADAVLTEDSVEW